MRLNISKKLIANKITFVIIIRFLNDVNRVIAQNSILVRGEGNIASFTHIVLTVPSFFTSIVVHKQKKSVI